MNGREMPEWVKNPAPAWLAQPALAPRQVQPVMTAQARMRARSKGHAAYVRAHVARAASIEAQPGPRTAQDQAAIRSSLAQAAQAFDPVDAPMPSSMRARYEGLRADGRLPRDHASSDLVW